MLFQHGREGITTTVDSDHETVFKQYEFPKHEVEFTGYLTYRSWHSKQPCLVCYFITEDAKHKLKLHAWWDKNYKPSKSDISFADDVTNNTLWRCTFRETKTGAIAWQTAELIPNNLTMEELMQQQFELVLRHNALMKKMP